MTHPSEKKTDVNSRKPLPRLLVGIAAIYLAWLLWLAYVAWVNVQSGNQ